MTNNFKNIIYPLLVLVIAASCSAPRYASAQDDGYYDNNSNQSYPNQKNDNYSYNQNQGNYNNQEYDNPNNYDENPSDVNINTFNDALNPYGRWIESPEYGRCWIAGQPGFVPYSSGGHWLYSSYGWTWASDYAWGWAPFHYGRWAYDPFYGWMWVPGYEWGPAWVSWRTGGGFYGWSPLGPGLNIGIGIGGGIPYDRWIFAPCRYMGYNNINHYYVAPSRNVTIIHNTTIINNTTVFNNHRFVAGPNRSDVERVTGRRVNAVQIQNASAPGRTVVSKDRIQMYRPGVTSRFQNANRNNNGANTQLMHQRNSDVNNQNQINRNNARPYVNDDRNQNLNHQNNPQVNPNTQPAPDQRYKLDNNRSRQIQQDNNHFNQHQQQQDQQQQNQLRQQQYQQMQQQQMQQRQQQMQQNQQRQQQFEQQRQQQIQQHQQQNSRPPDTRQFNNQSNNRSQSFSQPRQQSFSQPHFSGGGGRPGKHGF